MKTPETTITTDLYHACKLVLRLMKEGKLVRDITNDTRPDWGIRMMEFMMDLQKIQAAVLRAETAGYHERVEEGT